KRLDAEAIAREKQRRGVAIPERKSEHATEALDAVLTPRFPRMHDHLGVAARAKAMAKLHELGNELLIVVDLAVEDDDHAAVLVEPRLLPRLQVDDGKTLMAEA